MKVEKVDKLNSKQVQEIIKIRAETTEIKNIKIIQKINITKNLKTDKLD